MVFLLNLYKKNEFFYKFSYFECLMMVLHCCRNWVSVQRLLLVWTLKHADQDGSWAFCRNCYCLLCKWKAILFLMCSSLFNQSVDQSHYWYFSYNWLQFCLSYLLKIQSMMR